MMFAPTRRLPLSGQQFSEIINLSRGAGGRRPIPRQALANRYGVSLEDICRIINAAEAE